MNRPTVPRSEWPAQEDWPKPGWKHALNYQKFGTGDVFAWNEDGYFWTGIVEEIHSCAVKVRDVLPGVMK